MEFQKNKIDELQKQIDDSNKFNDEKISIASLNNII